MTAQQQLAGPVMTRIKRALEDAGWMNCEPEDWAAVVGLVRVCRMRVGKHRNAHAIFDENDYIVKTYSGFLRANRALGDMRATALRKLTQD